MRKIYLLSSLIMKRIIPLQCNNNATQWHRSLILLHIDFKFSVFFPPPNHIYYDLFVLVTTLKRTLRRLLDLVGWTGATAAGATHLSSPSQVLCLILMWHASVRGNQQGRNGKIVWIWRQDRMLQR